MTTATEQYYLNKIEELKAQLAAAEAALEEFIQAR